MAGWLLLAGVWAGVTASFWWWWLQQASDATPFLYWPETLALLYQTTVLPTFFFYYVSRMRRPCDISPLPGTRVAMITLCVPEHESLEVIHAQLEALQKVTYEHESWVLDEGASPEVMELAEQLGVRYFSRRGVARWNEPHPPFQKATKAGNVNAWLDHVGHLGLTYDVFVQLDIDHRPSPDYLDRVLGFFRDPRVGWVQAPSICGNVDNWAARGLAEQDMLFQGPLQMGFYGATGTPFIVGSHTAYRTEAVREIGGFQPTRAEDHLDTVVLAAQGYRGVYTPRVIAVGLGPTDFATYLRQQFAWAYSMIEIFLRHTPRLLRRYSCGQAIQFLTCQSWYLLWSLSLAVLWAIPTIALVLGRPIAEVSLVHFLIYFLPVPLVATMMWLWSKRWFQPSDLRLSWRGVLLAVARWPVVLWAFINVLLDVKRPYMITPKGVGRSRRPPLLSLYGPYAAIPAVPLAAICLYALSGSTPLRGYYAISLFSAAWGVALLVATLVIELRSLDSADLGGASVLKVRAGLLTAIGSMLCVFGITLVIAWQSILLMFP